MSTFDIAVEHLYNRSSQSEAVVDAMIRHGAKPGSPEHLHNYLQLAVGTGSVSVLRCLLEVDADPNFASSSDAQWDVGAAVYYNIYEKVRGSATDATDAIHRQEVSREMVRLLRKHGARLTLQEAAGIGDIAALKSLLVNTANVNAVDARGNTGLFLAVLNGDQEIINLLLAHGADPNGKSDLGTPLIAAMETRADAIVQILLAHGADPNLAIGSGTQVIAQTPLVAALCKAPQLVSILLKHGAQANPADGGPLLTAIALNRPDFVCLLLLHEANSRPTGGK